MASVEAIKRQGRVMYRGIPWDATNRKKGPTRVFETESAAMSYARGWERREDAIADEHGAPATRNRRRVLFTDYATQCAQRADIPKTRASKCTHAREWGRLLKGLHVDEIDRAAINAGLAAMSKLSAGTRRNRISFIRSVFAEAKRDGLITDDPTFDIDMPRRAATRTHNPPTEKGLKAALDYFDDWFAVAVLLAHDSGLRAAEVAGLRWFRVDFEQRTVMVADVMEDDWTLRPFPKGRKALEIPLSPRTVAMLRKVKLASGGGDTDFVVRRPNGKGFTGNTIGDHWFQHSPKIDGLGKPRPTFHDLRHAACQRLVDAGVDILTVSEIMRHSSLDVTRAYLRAVPMDRMHAAFAAASGA
jgi:integrase